MFTPITVALGPSYNKSMSRGAQSPGITKFSNFPWNKTWVTHENQILSYAPSTLHKALVKIGIARQKGLFLPLYFNGLSLWHFWHFWHLHVSSYLCVRYRKFHTRIKDKSAKNLSKMSF